MLYFMTIWNILQPFGIIYILLVQFVAIWHIFSVLVCLDLEKSGNHESISSRCCQPSSLFSALVHKFMQEIMYRDLIGAPADSFRLFPFLSSSLSLSLSLSLSSKVMV
jgi:hypothetical protein